MANEVRMTNARVRRELGNLTMFEGLARCADLIESEEVERMPVQRLLTSCKGVAHEKAKRFLLRAGITYGGRRVADLTERQRQELCDELREYAPERVAA